MMRTEPDRDGGPSIAATTVAIGGRAVLVTGPSGIGKTSLALQLIDRGAVLVADDRTVLFSDGDRLLATAPGSIAGMIEMRGIGIRPARHSGPVPVALVVALDPAAPRWIEALETRPLQGFAIPFAALSPHDPVLALKVEEALRMAGEIVHPLAAARVRPRADIAMDVAVSDSPHPVADDGPTEPATLRRRILLVTGLSGAGKSTVLRTLEDSGWEAIDNFPIRLLGRLLDTPPASGRDHGDGPLAIGFDSRTRGFDPVKAMDQVRRLAERPDIELATLFLDCSGSELERRFNETRRRHPLALDRPAAAGIAEERELLAPLRRWADTVISTTAFSANELQQRVRQQFGDTGTGATTVTILSFGFARGMPPLADLVFDMRFLDNPHWVDALRPLTGLDAPVAEHVRADPAFEGAYARIHDLLAFLLPRYAASGKPYVTIAFGCTGGRHRSVFMAESMAQDLRGLGISATVVHRNLSTRPADPIEEWPGAQAAEGRRGTAPPGNG